MSRCFVVPETVFYLVTCEDDAAMCDVKELVPVVEYVVEGYVFMLVALYDEFP